MCLIWISHPSFVPRRRSLDSGRGLIDLILGGQGNFNLLLEAKEAVTFLDTIDADDHKCRPLVNCAVQ